MEDKNSIELFVRYFELLIRAKEAGVENVDESLKITQSKIDELVLGFQLTKTA